ncbi:single-stranded DNA-binding protein [Nocardioides sp. T2.26MG-1]|uniref:single-stranded DNA-binding protein n=1 Tax=Nocardioides sp. T2.26MG-1 TaxID=3041166 RepID=UPI002477B1AA|nr:single-stranded DNA-binding protein [Nocardioides sp. T2.26MG-1]CAI9415313.1 Single-stranded DNA-binding protein [Nocardioides sp. T2.26MG-1]
MTAHKTARTTRDTDRAIANEVRLVGRVSQQPEERVLPSGDSVWTFRVVVPRAVQSRSRQSVDALECAAWSPRARRSVSTWAADDVVEVSGSLRRRFFRAAGGAASRVEVEMSSGRVIGRAGSG